MSKLVPSKRYQLRQLLRDVKLGTQYLGREALVIVAPPLAGPPPLTEPPPPGACSLFWSSSPFWSINLGCKFACRV